MSDTVYVFDTSSLIGCWVRLYPPDAFPRLWLNMDGLIGQGRLIMPEEVLEELSAQDDDLHAWVKQRSQAVVPTTRAVMLAARLVLQDYPYLTKSGMGRGKADPFVIALALDRGCAVVTQEQGGTAAKPRIPYVCAQRGVTCLPALEVIRLEGWKF